MLSSNRVVNNSTGEHAYNESAHNEPFITNKFAARRFYYFITYHGNNELDSLITNLISQKYTIIALCMLLRTTNLSFSLRSRGLILKEIEILRNKWLKKSKMRKKIKLRFVFLKNASN